MASRPASAEDWFRLIPNLLHDQGWRLEVDRGPSRLLHQSSPWGGYLVRFSFKDLGVCNPPSDPAMLFVRPEVRASYLGKHPELNEEAFEVVQLFSPGNTVVERLASWKFFRLCNVFFCDLREEDSLPDLYCPKIRGRMYQTVRRNFPKPGFSIFTLRSVSGAFDVICVGIPQLSAGLFTIEVALRIPKFAGWASMHFPTLLLSLRDLVHWFLNRPGVHDMRSLDSQFYLVLTMQTWRRGFPFLPAVDDEEAKDTLTTINAGRRRGLVTWVRYHPRMVGSEFFHLSEYLSLFLQRIGMPLTLHQSLDGQELLPYQCAVQEELWQQIAPHFRRAYMLQKTAYRRANGGSTAPAITEGTEPRFGDRSTASRPGPEEAAKPSWNIVIRNTFVEMEEDPETPSAANRCRTTSPLRDARDF